MEIYTDKIFERYPDPHKYDLMCALELLHQLAHAVLDPSNYLLSDESLRRSTISFNYNLFRNCFPTRNPKAVEGLLPQKKLLVDFYTYREESLAESMVFTVIKKAPKGLMLNAIEGGQRGLLDMMLEKRSQYQLAKHLLEDGSYRFAFARWIEMKSREIPASNLKAVKYAASEWLDLSLDILETVAKTENLLNHEISSNKALYQ